MSLFRTLLKPQNFLYKTHKHISFSSIILHRTLVSSPKLEPTAQHDRNQKATDLLFQEAVGVGSCETTKTNIEARGEGTELKRKMRHLKAKLRDLKEAESKNGKESENVNRKREVETPNKVVYSSSTEKSEITVEMNRQEGKEEEDSARAFKELSPDMEMFVSHLYKEGYFSQAHFLRQGLDFSCLVDDYARDFIKFAAEKFAKDHQDIAKWLSGSHLKKVAFFGCPCLTKKNVVAAKRLRAYFKIQEDTVCGKCALKHSCKFVNQKIWGGTTKVLDLDVIMRVITLYAMEAVHPELSIPNEIKASVSSLLNEVLKLSQTT